MCNITKLTRRICSSCRLNKCFKQGMKKELIRSSIAIRQATFKMRMSNKHDHEKPLRRLAEVNLLTLT